MDTKKKSVAPDGQESVKADQPCDASDGHEAVTGEISSEECRVRECLHAQIRELSAKVVEYESKEKAPPEHCTCPDSDFEFEDADAHVEAAEIYLKDAKLATKKENEEKATRRSAILVALNELIVDRTYITREKLEVGNLQQAKNVHNIIQALTDEIVEIREPTTKDIVDVLSSKKSLLQQFGYADIVHEKPEELEKLFSACTAQSTIKTYLRKLTSDAMDMSTLKIPQIWREKWLVHAEESAEGKVEKAAFRELAEKANKYCEIFFGQDGLDPAIHEENNVDNLLTIVRTTLPDSPEKYHMLASSIAKLNIMHLVDYIDTKVSFPQLRIVSEHLKKKLRPHQAVQDGEMEFFCARDGNPDNYVAIHDIDFPDPKNDIAIARKLAAKDMQFTRDFRLEDIRDLIRLSIILSEEDSTSLEKMEEAAKKIMAIFISLIGTDMPNGRLRYSLDSGKTNGHSTGKHRAFHFTFWYRAQCDSFGNDKRGKIIHDMIPVEVQIKPFMFKEEVKEDHKVYENRKDEKIRKYMGMNVPYPEFVRNLCEAILFCDDFPDRSKRNARYGFERPIKEKWVLTLVSMLNRRTETGALANEYTIRKICENPMMLEKVRKVLSLYIDKESGIVRQQADDIADMKKGPKKPLKRRFMKVLAREKNVQETINKAQGVENKQISSHFLDEEILEKMTNEEIVDAMMALNGGWRQDLNEEMKGDGLKLPHETGLNILAKRAMSILEEYEQKMVKLRSSVSPGPLNA